MFLLRKDCQYNRKGKFLNATRQRFDYILAGTVVRVEGPLPSLLAARCDFVMLPLGGSTGYTALIRGVKNGCTIKSSTLFLGTD